MKKSANPQSRQSQRDLMNAIMDLYAANPSSRLTRSDLYKAFKMKTHPAKMVMNDILDELVSTGYLTLSPSGHYLSPLKHELQTGTMVRHGGRQGFIPTGEENLIYVSDKNALNAYDGDQVEANVWVNPRKGGREAEIMNVVKRAKDTFVGTLQIDKHFAFLSTPDRYLPSDIFIPKTALLNAHNGDKAVVKVVEWPSSQNRSPVGEVVDVLGATGENNTEMHAILAEFGLPYSYPENLEKLANKIPSEIPESEIRQRLDYRDVTTFTIDPRDAKDFDDAISIKRLDDGPVPADSDPASATTPVWEVGVHIADVTHYLREGSPIDKEAYQRATSVYLVDRTIPMLPERLCNFVCSLRPDEDKLTYSVIFQMNNKAEVLSHRIVRTVTRSNRRFTYEQAQLILEQNGQASEEDLTQPSEHPTRFYSPKDKEWPVGDYAKELITLNRLAKILRQKRIRKGAIEFQREEVHFEIDEKGHPTGTYIKVSQDAHKLVEEFMLLANRYVAQEIGMVPKGTKAKTFVYRVHDVPDPQKLERLSSYVSRFGYGLKTLGSKQDVASSINRMLHDVEGKPQQKLIEEVTLRSMMKAVYSTHNIGHYGLMFRYYTHFTSPIRRYPDQMVHRLLTRYLDQKGRSANQVKLEDQCRHCSDMEQLAANAERASIKYKQVEYMGDFIGQEFEGKVSGVTDFAVYVELTENKCEGAVPLRTISDDYYSYDPDRLEVVGRRRHHRISLGDPVRIRVAEANLERRQLDFELLEVKGKQIASSPAPQSSRRK